MGHGAVRIVGHTSVLVLAVVVLLGAVTGCARRAPGPGECYEFARGLVGIPEQAVALPEQVASLVESEAVRCLTTPYDRELIACVGAGSSKRRCAIEFELRTAHGRGAEER
jgi:hypothetical protein